MNPITARPPLCPVCRTPVPFGASEGLCPCCLLAGGIAWQSVQPPAAESADLPRRFGGFELLEKLAEGGMGVVYRARQLKLDRIVALKMIRAGHFAGPDEVRRFQQEARAAAKLDHPGIVPVFEVGEHAGMHYFTMKLAAGGCLQLRARPPREAASLLIAVARALHYAHQHGVLHRDLKPSNILLEADGTPMVSDFGLARLTDCGADITMAGSVLGTPAWMAPEQAGGDAGFTTASDVYSLGALLYGLLTGSPPFPGSSHYEIMRRTVEDEPGPLRLARPDRDLEIICLKCLRKEPARRYASAEAMADDLQRWLRGEPVHARVTGTRERLVKWARRRPAQAALILVSVLGTATVLVSNLAGEAKLRRERNYARDQEAKATEAARLTAESERAARLQLYAADVFLANSALTNGDCGRARLALEAHRPAGGRPDLRGFEWYCLHHRCQGDPCTELSGHADAVTSVEFSRDGTRLLTAGRDGQVLVRPAGGGPPVLTIPTPSARILRHFEHATMTPVFLRSPAVARRLLTGGERYDRLLTRTRPGLLGEVRTAVFSPDGTAILTGSQWSWTRIWNAETGALTWVTPATDCRCAAWLPGGTHLVLGDSGRQPELPPRVSILDATSHEETLTILNSTGVFALSADGSTLAVSMADGRMELRHPPDGSLRASWEAGGPIRGLTISENGRRLAGIAGNEAQLYIWDETGRAIGPLTHDGDRIRAVALTRDGKLLASGGVDHAVKLWDADTGDLLRTLRGHTDEVLSLAFSPDARQLATGCRDQLTRLWDISTPGIPEERFPAAHPVLLSRGTVIENDPDGAVRTGPADGSTRITLPGGTFRRVLTLTEDGSGFLTITRDHPAIEWWRLDGTPERQALPFPDDATSICAAASAASGLAASVSARHTLTVINTATRAIVRQSAAGQSIHRLKFSPDGQRLLEFRWPRGFTVTEAVTGATISGWQVPGAETGTFTWSPDGRLVVLGGTDNLVSVYDAATGERTAVLRGHKADIKAAVFSPDGRTLATSSDSRTLKLWHVPTWRELATISRDAVFTFLAFTPDNDCLWAWEYERDFRRFPAPRN